MPRVAIITDSACDLDREQLAAQGVTVVPLTVSFGQRLYADGVDLTRDEFYHLLTTSTDPALTAQPSPGAYAVVYRHALETAEHVVVICLSAGLSGTCESALLAKAEMLPEPDRIIVFDSRAASIGQALMVLGAAERAAAGQSPQAILAFLEDMRDRLSSVFTLDTLEYLVRGGRLGRVQGLVGALLNVKPILELDPRGKIVPREKVRGRRQSIERLLEIVRDEGRRLEGQRVGVCHARAFDEAADLAEQMRKRFRVQDVLIGEISATIGTHVGPGCLAVFFQR